MHDIVNTIKNKQVNTTSDNSKDLPNYIFDKIIGYADLKKTDYFRRIKSKRDSRTGFIDLSSAFMGTVLAEKWNTKLIETKIKSNWPKIVGDSVANMVLVNELRNKTLIITVENNTWATTLKLGKNELINKINKILESELIQNIDIRLKNSNNNANITNRRFYRRPRKN